MVILCTDALLYLLLAIAIWLAFIIVNNQHLHSQWQKAYKQPIKMVAMLVLLTFILIGLIDSIHFQSGPNIISVLDWLLQPVSEQLETSYSPPFATELFVENMIKDSQGNITWVKEKLEYVNPVAILPEVFYGVLLGIGAWAFIAAIGYLLYRRLNWTALLTIAAICIIIAICRRLMINYHIFGTDKIGNDVFYASVKSIRTGLVIGSVTTLVTLPFAILFGTVAGYFRGWVDDVIQYVYTTLSSIPAVLLIAAAVLTLDATMQRYDSFFTSMEQRTDTRLLILCLILGITSWTTLCRLLRAETLKLRDYDFILAAKVMGLSKLRIIYKHIVPNLFHIIIITIVLDFSMLVLAEAVLSYVGVGVDPSTFSWGNMINSARMELGREPIIWWALTGALVLMFAMVLAANIFADGVRDAFDPRTE